MPYMKTYTLLNIKSVKGVYDQGVMYLIGLSSHLVNSPCQVPSTTTSWQEKGSMDGRTGGTLFHMAHVYV